MKGSPFSPEFLRWLETLRLALRRSASGAREGDRPAGRAGGGTLHRDQRPYAQGDDVRAIDWNLYARLGQLFVREREKEHAVRLHVVLDGSASMRSGSKPAFAKRVAAMLGVVAEAGGGDAVLLCGAPVALTLERLEAVQEGPPASVSVRSLPERATAVVITDPWDDARPAAPAALVHVLDRDEQDPPMRGMVRLADSESGETADRFIGDEEAAAYRRLLDDRCARMASDARRRSVGYVRCTADEPMDEVVRKLLAEGVVR